MDNQLKQQFTLRITQANKTELCVILYEMFIVYCNDATHCIDEDDVKSFRVNIQRARGCLKELMDSLHFEYEPAPTLLNLYIYISKLLVSADLHNATAPLEEAVHIMQSLHDSFETVSKQDTSGQYENFHADSPPKNATACGPGLLTFIINANIHG